MTIGGQNNLAPIQKTPSLSKKHAVSSLRRSKRATPQLSLSHSTLHLGRHIVSSDNNSLIAFSARMFFIIHATVNIPPHHNTPPPLTKRAQTCTSYTIL